MASPPDAVPADDLVAALRSPGAYPHRVASVELIQTHISWIFLAGDFAYKVKKPVDHGFLDFSTLERRRHFCHEEVRLNRRLAPDTYLGVVDIVRGPGGRLRVGGESGGHAVEHAVHMRRLPEERMMAGLLDRGEMDDTLLRTLTEILVRFHDEADTGEGVDEHGRPDAVARNVLDNLAALDPAAAGGDGALSTALHGHLEAAARGFLEGRRALLEERVRSARIRDGHGDLHAGNVCFPDGRVVIYDCIEFSPRFRCGDVAGDVAFLAMDLDLRGFRGFASHLAHLYAEQSGDEGLEDLLGFYKSYRALVRAKVAALKARDAGVAAEDAAAARAEAGRYAELAASYTLPGALVLMCGLPATGKSHVARHLLVPFEPAVLRSDVVRKRLAGLAPETRAEADFGEGIYAPESSDATYGALLETARERLSEGRTVVVDAAFASRRRRAPFVELARETGSPLVVVHVEVDERTALERLAERRRTGRDASDAGRDVYMGMREAFEPPEEIPADRLVEVSGAADPGTAAAAVLDRVVSGA